MNAELDLLEAQRKDTEAHLEKLKDKIAKMTHDRDVEQQRPFRALAARAHNLLCQYNHTDGCSWGYEGDGESAWVPPGGSRNYSAHSRWLATVMSICAGRGEIKPVSIEKLSAFLDSLETFRKDQPDALFLLSQLRR